MSRDVVGRAFCLRGQDRKATSRKVAVSARSGRIGYKRKPAAPRPATASASPAHRVILSRENLIAVGVLGRVAGHSPEARGRQAETQRRHAAELKAWNPADKPDWLTEEVYGNKIQPSLASITVPAIALALGVSQPYAAEIRAGRYVPHPRHWQILANLVGVSTGN